MVKTKSAAKDEIVAEARVRRFVHHAGNLLVEGFHLLGLFAIGASTVWAAAATFLSMVAKGHASIEDLLLLFIYLEIGAMVGIYFKTNRMPVRFLIYVGITAVTRHVCRARTRNRKWKCCSPRSRSWCSRSRWWRCASAPTICLRRRPENAISRPTWTGNRSQTSATGRSGEPVAPLMRSGSVTNAKSARPHWASASRSRFSMM